jgi:hypothetical protein
MTLRRLAILVGMVVVIATSLALLTGWPPDPNRQQVTRRPKAAAESPGALARMSGVFEAQLEFFVQGTTNPIDGTGLETRELSSDGRWLVRRLSGTLDKQAFSAVSVVGFDEDRKHFTATWADSRLRSIALIDATYSVDTESQKGRLAGRIRPGAQYGSEPLALFEEELAADGSGELRISEQRLGSDSSVVLKIRYRLAEP